jgi:hypothetical protein
VLPKILAFMFPPQRVVDRLMTSATAPWIVSLAAAVLFRDGLLKLRAFREQMNG